MTQPHYREAAMKPSSLFKRVYRLSAIAASAMVFQAGGCAIDPQELVAQFATIFSNLVISTVVNGVLGVPAF